MTANSLDTDQVQEQASTTEVAVDKTLTGQPELPATNNSANNSSNSSNPAADTARADDQPERADPADKDSRTDSGYDKAVEGGDNRRGRARGNRRRNKQPAVEITETIDLDDIRKMSISQLMKKAAELSISYTARVTVAALVNKIAMALAKPEVQLLSSGIVEVVGNTAFLRHKSNSYQADRDDIFVSNNIVRKFDLRTGDEVRGTIRAPVRAQDKYFSLIDINLINGRATDDVDQRVFSNLTPLFPDEQFELEIGTGGQEDMTPRVIDLISPIGKGQRALIVSPPKAGKTVILQTIANALEAKYPEAAIMVLLVDERPEEVTEMARQVRGEVIASTFDEPAVRHVQAAEIVIGRAKRMVEQGKDVVVLLDSITRLARAYNTVQPASGKILTGGVDANALERPKRFFGTARNIEGGGSLTIIATALVDTGSRMDEVIFEEFKGTGNMELHLERKLYEKRIFPAINIRRSGTRREDLLMSEDHLHRVWILRKLLHSMDEAQAMEWLLEHLKESQTNEQFFSAMKNR